MSLAQTLADHLEPWWRCVHPPDRLTHAMEIGYCGRCEAERLEAAKALAPIAAQAISEMLPALTEGDDREGTARWPDAHREVYSLAIEEACSAVLGMGGAA